MGEALFVERKVPGEKGKDQSGKQRVGSSAGGGVSLAQKAGTSSLFSLLYFWDHIRSHIRDGEWKAALPTKYLLPLPT